MVPFRRALHARMWNPSNSAAKRAAYDVWPEVRFSEEKVGDGSRGHHPTWGAGASAAPSPPHIGGACVRREAHKSS